MIDPGVQIRAAYYSIIGTSLMWSGTTVPVVDEKLDVNITESDVYVLMQNQQEQTDGVSNKTYFVDEVNIVMHVVNQRKDTNTKEVVENVSAQILALLFPTRTTTTLTLSAPLRLTYAKKVSANYQPLVQNENGFLIIKELTFKNRITQ